MAVHIYCVAAPVVYPDILSIIKNLNAADVNWAVKQ